ncbi:hypothetical protein [Streptomyces sp. NRRL S-118]|nr:hypothetical protein [Streptomyces sp. NRRL S-118]
MVSVHDHKRTARSLVLCEGSMRRVPAVDATMYQEELPDGQDTRGAPAQGVEAPPLF